MIISENINCIYSDVVKYIKNTMSKERLEHTLSVAEECMYFADIFKLSENERHTLYLAALFHDITKENTPEEHIEMCRVYNIEYNEAYLSTPALFHALTGGRYAMEIFPSICTQEIVDLISTHTTGCENMSLLQKILFTADSTEKTRKHKSCIELRNFFRENIKETDPEVLLDRTVIMSLDSTITHLIQTNRPIDPQTVSTRNYLLKQVRL